MTLALISNGHGQGKCKLIIHWNAVRKGKITETHIVESTKHHFDICTIDMRMPLKNLSSIFVTKIQKKTIIIMGLTCTYVIL